MTRHGPKANLLRNFRKDPRTYSESDTFSLDPEASARSILSREDEQRWATHRVAEGVRAGAITMMVIASVVYVGIFLSDFHDQYPTFACSETPVELRYAYAIVRYGFPGVSLAIFYRCYHRPRELLIPYTITVSAFFFFFVMIGLPAPPALVIDGECAINNAVNKATSSLRRHCTVHSLMAWILFTPMVFPLKNMLHLTWAYIVVGYLGTSLYWHFFFDDGRDRGQRNPRNLEWWFSCTCCTAALAVVNAIAINKKYYIDKGERSKFVMDLKHKESTRRMFNILEYMVPVHLVAPMLKNPGKVIAEQVECASILFIMFVDFDQTASRLEPHELLDFLNHHFTLFDMICAKHGVTKIETVGEEYVCAVGVVPADVERSREEGHQEILGRLIATAAEILRVAEENEKVDLKMGIHTGPVVAGVIGHKLPRFRLFGDTINTAARMMQKGLTGELQFGEETFRALPRGVEVEHRGQIEMKGKGQVTTYLLRREKRTPVLTAAPASQSIADEPLVMEAPAPEGAQEGARKSKKSVAFAGEAPAPESAQQAAPKSKSVAFAVDGEQQPRPSEVRRSKAHSFASQRASRKSICDLLMEGTDSLASYASSDASDPNALSFSARRPSTRASSAAASATAAGGRVREVEMAFLGPQSREGEQPSAAETLLPRPPQARVVSFADSGTLSRDTVSQISFNSRNEDDAEEAFEKTVQEVCAAHGVSETSEEADASLFKRARTWIFSFGPGWNSFPEEMEEAFIKWYHETAIVKKLDRRLELHLTIGSVLTTMDMIYTVFVTRAFSEDQPLGLPIFLASRSLVCLIVAGWRTAFEVEWIKKVPKDVQFRIVLSYGLIAILWFISYDMVSSKRIRPKGEMEQTSTHGPDQVSTHSDIFSLMFIPIYFYVTTLHPLLFTHSCVFAIEAVLIVYMSTRFDGLHFGLVSGIVLVGNSVLNTFFTHHSEKSLRARFKANSSIALAQDRIEHILNTLMPVQVVEEIRDNELNAPPRAHTYRFATVAQSDLCGFTKLASTRRPEEVVEFIGELFGMFDELTDEYEVYKVETVGDAYIAGQADIPLTYKNSPVSVVLFGLDMIRATHEWSRKRGENVSCRVGVHTGECVGGIVGSEMQRYHLFGRLMTGLEVLESTAPEGRVQVSVACKEAVERGLREEGREVSMFEPRQEARLTTSKGEVHEYEEVGGVTYVAKSYAQIRGQLKV